MVSPTRSGTPIPDGVSFHDYPCPDFDAKNKTITGLMGLLEKQVSPGTPLSDKAATLAERIRGEFAGLEAIIKRIHADPKSYMVREYNEARNVFLALFETASTPPQESTKTLPNLMGELRMCIHLGTNPAIQALPLIQQIKREFKTLAEIAAKVGGPARKAVESNYAAKWAEFSALVTEATGKAPEPILIGSKAPEEAPGASS